MRGSQSFPVEVAADGSCAVEDVPPGTYILSARFLEAPVATVDRDSLKGQRESSPIRHEITVLDFVQGTTQEPLDLGTLAFRAGPQKASR
jgi:hypothetical protein